MASDSFVISNGNGNGNSQPNPQRTYQAVVVATRDMGISKDGKMPWILPTDLKFFEEITTITSDPGKKNAVVMGRKTWESIPPESRPLCGRLNVVLTRSGSFDIATAENVLTCGSVSSAMELLAASPYCLSIEKVFLTGGGEIFRCVCVCCLMFFLLPSACYPFIIMLSSFFVVADDFHVQRGSKCTWM